MTKTKTPTISDVGNSEAQSVPLAWIDIPENRARSFDPDEAAALAPAIAAAGLIHPIRVRIIGNRYCLVAGRKRLEAMRLLGWDAIPITISAADTDDEARLEEVMENLGRFDLTKLDRAQHLYELKQVYERLHPEKKHGGDRKSEIKTQNLRLDADASEVLGFAAATAEKIGLSRRSIELAVKLWTDLTPDSRKRAAGSWLADHQSGLKELSEQSPADQAKVLDMVLADPPSVATISEAVMRLETGIALTPTEKKIISVSKGVQSLAKPVAAVIGDRSRIDDLQEGIATLKKFLGRLEDHELDSVIVEHEERIIASLKRRGRI
ncbi:ParB/RepB/Spo0J family partition protein [Rhizobium sp. SL86]|uniref:ParB/RepB/Spo0J family partition protein n=1 Tax=Rhizobium sp. SL86 TaxID=2995148 RepID=UPI0022757343|nr:ParB N-terminal domain-containing protein [Rhizobium sp. SL86]MCY1668063.1 ParB N-terminal domain-containing protein [Rhizobium sp. SL86]